MRCVFRFGFALALGLALMAGCSDENGGEGGSGGTAGTGGTAGEGGSGGSTGQVFPCTEQGIRDAIAMGGGPHTFGCTGPTTVVTEAEIVIDNDVILDGEANLAVDGNESHRVFAVPEGIEAELHGFEVTKGFNVVYGGGIWNAGTLTLVDSTVSQSSVSRGDAGGIYSTGTLTLLNSKVSDNAGGRGAIRNEGSLSLLDSAVTDNQKLGISNGGTLTLTRSTVTGNIGGGILSWVNATLTDSTVSGNIGGGVGALGSLTVIHGVVSGNTGTRGGGIYSRGEASVRDSTISENTAGLGGAAGIFNGGTLTLTNSTVSANTTAEGYGGGIANDGAMTLLNSTVSGNRAIEGGGIWNLGTLALIHVTVSDNAEGGIAVYDQSDCFPGCDLPSMTSARTVMDGECRLCRPGDGIVYCDQLAVLGGRVESGGYNIESVNGTCGFDQTTDQVDVTTQELGLGPLADNGGPTTTHALLTEPTVSVAIDQIPEADCVDADGQPLTADQRGEPRPVAILGAEPRCDVGAFEVQP